MNERLDIVKTRHGYPALWVGGGATTSKFSARFVMRAGELARAIFIAQHGHRCNSGQALIGLREGDIVIEVSGRRPPSPDNPEIYCLARKIVGFGTDEQNNPIAYVEYIDVDLDTIPASVWQGCSVYHNRDGHYFIAE